MGTQFIKIEYSRALPLITRYYTALSTLGVQHSPQYPSICKFYIAKKHRSTDLEANYLNMFSSEEIWEKNTLETPVQ